MPELRDDPALADPVEGAVHRDPVDPGAKRGTLLIGFQSLIPAQKRLLHYLLRIGFVGGDPKCHPEDSRTVSADKGSVCFLVPGQHGPDNRVIASLHSAP